MIVYLVLSLCLAYSARSSGSLPLMMGAAQPLIRWGSAPISCQSVHRVL